MESQTQSNFETALSTLRSKSKAKRISSLNALCHILENEFTHIELDEQIETLCDALNASLQHDVDESTLAMHALGLTAIVLGVECSELIPVFLPLLSSLSRSHPSLFSKAIQTKTILLFLGDNGNDSTHEIDHLINVINAHDEDDELEEQCIALECCSVLISSLPPSLISTHVLPLCLKSFCEILEASPSTKVRIAAGNAVALVISLHRTFLESEEKSFDLCDLNEHISVRQLTQSLSASTFNRDISHDDQSSVKSAFRQILQSIENVDYEVSYSIKIKSNNEVELKEWARLVQVRFFKNVLANGFLQHLQFNDIFAQIFEFQLQCNSTKRPKHIAERLSREAKLRKERKNSIQAQCRSAFAHDDEVDFGSAKPAQSFSRRNRKEFSSKLQFE